MHCPNCGSAASADQTFCRTCGLSLPEFSQLLAEKLPTQPEELQVQKRKAERWALRLWTLAGVVFYIAFYWTIISEIIIGKGHVLGGILFLLVVTAISLGGLLLLYSAALQKHSAYRRTRQTEKKDATTADLLDGQPAELAISVTEQTTELLEKNVANEQQQDSFREQ